jgi:tetratricopeptide (TPR) repeat protein
MSSQAQDLVAKKNYAKALDVIKAELARRPKDQRLRLQQADVLILAGKGREAVAVLLGLADEHAADGFAAKAIAILKRIEKIDPGRRDVEDRLARLIQEKVSQAPTAARPAAAPDFGIEEVGDAPEIELGVSSASAEAPPPAASEELEGLDYIAQVEPEPEPQPALSSPLFEGLSQQELVALIHGLKLLTFAPGDILVGEGAPGDSMFIITTGRVKAYVRDPKGHFLKVQELGEGAFFGEISILTGKPRTATITAASNVEVLELDKATLDSITQTYPRIRETLERFRVERAEDTVKKIIKSQR